jgi:hypothetical protein
LFHLASAETSSNPVGKSDISDWSLVRLGIWLSNHNFVVSVFTIIIVALDYVSTYMDRAKYPSGFDLHPFVMFNPIGISLRLTAVSLLIIFMNKRIPFKLLNYSGDIQWFAHLANLPVIFLTLSVGVVPNLLLYFLGTSAPNI